MVEGDIERKGEKYKVKFKHEYMMIPDVLVEHFDALNVEYDKDDKEIKYWMERVNINKQDIVNSIGKIKNGNQPGPDEMKGEVYKWMMESEICLKIFEKCFNEIMETGKPPESWKRSKTVMIPKEKKPKVKDFCLIALTIVEYKIFMSVIKEKIVTHLIVNDEVHCLQMGFTRGRTLEDNLFILVYCLRSAERMKKNLIITAVDLLKHSIV